VRPVDGARREQHDQARPGGRGNAAAGAHDEAGDERRERARAEAPGPRFDAAADHGRIVPAKNCLVSVWEEGMRLPRIRIE
jgi:hypothetical protein